MATLALVKPPSQALSAAAVHRVRGQLPSDDVLCEGFDVVTYLLQEPLAFFATLQ